MITQEMKDDGIMCKSQGFNCYKCKDKNECVDYVHMEQKEEIQKCYNCNSECKEVYQIRVIDASGRNSFEKVCSIKCAEKIRKHFYDLHTTRAEIIMDTSIQKLR